MLAGSPVVSPVARSSLPARAAHGAAPSRWKASRAAVSWARALSGGLHPAQPLTEGELDAGVVEWPAVGAGHRERSLEQRGCRIIGGRERGRSLDDQCLPGRDRGDTGLAHGSHVSRGLGMPAGPDGGLSEVQGQPQRVRYMVG